MKLNFHLLCVAVCPGDLAELRLVVTNKVAHVVLCGILDVGQLLADAR